MESIMAGPDRHNEIVFPPRHEESDEGESWGVIGLAAVPAVVILAVLYWPVLRDLVKEWENPNYAHGYLVPVFSGYLVWRQRRALAALVPQGRWIGLSVLLAGLGALVLGSVAAERYLLESSLIVVLGGLVLLHLGPAVFRRVAFPLGFLLFMVPLHATIFYLIAFPLQRIAAQNAAWSLDVLGIPVILDGNVIQLSQITLGVTEACSGVRSLISMLAVAVGWGHLTLRGGWSKAIFIASAVPITVVANAGRVVATGLIGQYLGIEYAMDFFHTFSGWVIALVAGAGLLAVHGLIRLVQGRSPARARVTV